MHVVSFFMLALYSEYSCPQLNNWAYALASQTTEELPQWCAATICRKLTGATEFVTASSLIPSNPVAINICFSGSGWI